MRTRNILAALLLMVAGLQTAAAQGFRVYKSDGTIMQFSLRTDSIVFYDGIGTDVDFGPFTPVNQMIVGTWYVSKNETVTFNEDGTTDYISGGTYRFLPYQGSIVIYNASGVPVNIFKVHNVADGTMIVSTLDGSFRVWGATPQPQPVTSIALSESDITLKVNETQTLTVSISEDAGSNEVIWESSNTAVATVDQNGKVTAVAKGSCLITVTAADGSGKTAACAVTVVQPVTSITLNETSITLPTGASQTLTATVLPSSASNKKVTWKSSNTAVASVDQSGKVTAVEQGSCIVTATATDGSGVKAECQVTVEHECVDLGLPSGTLWATCNIGANSPEEYGDYFAWGETSGYKSGKTDFSWETYKWCDGSEYTMTKYCTDSSYGNNGFTDGKTELEAEDDAATVNWGGYWQMPSQAQFEELINSRYTTAIWTTQNDVNGLLIVSNSNGNRVFLPAAGTRYDADRYEAGSWGFYWSRSLYSEDMDYYPYFGHYLFFNLGSPCTSSNSRYCGQSVRPVRVLTR